MNSLNVEKTFVFPKYEVRTRRVIPFLAPRERGPFTRMSCPSICPRGSTSLEKCSSCQWGLGVLKNTVFIMGVWEESPEVMKNAVPV